MNPYSPPTFGSPPPPVGGYGLPSQGTRDDRAGVTDITVEMMRQTKPWVMMVGVLSLIGAGFMLLGGIAMIGMGLVMPRSGAMPTAALGLVYLPMAAIYVYPGLKLWSYGKSIGQLLVHRSPSDLEAALGHQKSFWKFVGILTLAIVALYILALGGVMIAGVIGASRMH